jgi:hypothetical protein
MAAADAAGGRVSWRRYATLAVPTVGVAVLLVLLVGRGAVAASFAVAGDSFKLSAATLDGEGFTSYSGAISGADGADHAVAPAGFRTATLTGLCQSIVSSSPLGPVTMRLTAGDEEPVTASNLVTSFDALQGDLTFGEYTGGVDAAQLTGGPAAGPSGVWGQQAGTIHVDNLRLRTWSTTAATFVLKDLDIEVSFGTNECF